MTVSPAPSVQIEQQVGPSGALTCVVEEIGRGELPGRERWLGLLERGADGRVQHHPDYIVAAWVDLGIPGLTITCLREGVAVGMAILLPKRCRFGRQALPGARSSFVGLRLVGSTLLGAEEPELTRRLVQEVGAEVRRRRIRVVEFEQLREDSLLWQALQQLGGEGFRFAPANAFDSHHRIRLAPSAAEFWRGFNSKHRLRMRKEREKFGDYTLRCVRGEGEVDEWLAAAHEVSRKSWQSGQLGLRISNSEEDRRYLTALAKLGAWRSYILFREGTPAAFALSFQWRGVYYYDEIGFDRSLLKLYPGKVMLQEILTDVMTQDVARLFDFGLGDAEYKRAFANEQSRSAKLWMFPLGLRGRWQTASIDGHRKLGRAVRKLVAHMPWYEALRGKLRNAAAK